MISKCILLPGQSVEIAEAAIVTFNAVGEFKADGAAAVTSIEVVVEGVGAALTLSQATLAESHAVQVIEEDE